MGKRSVSPSYFFGGRVLVHWSGWSPGDNMKSTQSKSRVEKRRIDGREGPVTRAQGTCLCGRHAYHRRLLPPRGYGRDWRTVSCL